MTAALTLLRSEIESLHNQEHELAQQSEQATRRAAELGGAAAGLRARRDELAAALARLTAEAAPTTPTTPTPAAPKPAAPPRRK